MIRARGPSRRRGQILILLLASLLGGSGLIGVGIFATGRSIDEIEDRVGDAVGDKARRKAAETVLDAWKDEGESFLEANAERRDDLLLKLERHATTPAELRADFAAMRSANARIQATVLDRRFALRELLTREEWQKVFPR